MRQFEFNEVEMWDDSAWVLHFSVRAKSGKIIQCKISQIAMLDHFGAELSGKCLSREQATKILEDNIQIVLGIVNEKIQQGDFIGQFIEVVTDDL